MRRRSESRAEGKKRNNRLTFDAERRDTFIAEGCGRRIIHSDTQIEEAVHAVVSLFHPGISGVHAGPGRVPSPRRRSSAR